MIVLNVGDQWLWQRLQSGVIGRERMQLYTQI
jgi:hypothetical protein